MEKKHFLIITYPAQGHINPALHLAHRLSESTSAQVTFSTSISAHRKMFPNISSPNQEVTVNSVTYLPFTDGSDDGYDPKTTNVPEFFSKYKTVGSESIASLLDRLQSTDRPVDCMLYTLMLPWVARIARTRGIPSVQYWIQPATVFVIYYHAFLRGYERTITEKINDPLSTVDLPGVPRLQVKDLPSFLMRSSDSDEITKALFEVFKEGLCTLQEERDATKENPKVLVNTFEELEPDALASVDDVDLIPVGPTLGSQTASNADLFKADEKRYVEWLDSKPEKSVVYVSFGSLFMMKKEQAVEILKGLEGSGRPYLWVLRDESRYEDMEMDGQSDNGIIVNWCKQMDVLKHPSVGCFVTHCGWNSTLESLVNGVPVVAVPQWTDQGTNAVLMEKVWGNAVRGETRNDGFIEGKELQRCLELVLGDGEEGVGIRQKAEMWKKKAKEALMEGGSSDRNLKAFVNGVSKSHV